MRPVTRNVSFAALEQDRVGSYDQRVQLDGPGRRAERRVELLQSYTADPPHCRDLPAQAGKAAAVGRDVETEAALEAPVGRGVAGPASQPFDPQVTVGADA